MGILRNGIFGGFEKKTGPLVGRRIRGKNVISAVRHPVLKERTVAQTAHILKFTMVTSFLRLFRTLIAIGFAGKGNAFSMAVSYNFKQLIIGTAPEYTIDYAKFKFSRGKLAGPSMPSANKIGDSVFVNWLAEEQNQFNRHTDKACFAIYCPAKRLAVIYLFKGRRAELFCDLQLPLDFTTELLYVYMSFTSVDGKMSSDTAYLGTI